MMGLFYENLSTIFAKLNRRYLIGSEIHPWSIILDKAFKNGPSKICGRQPLKQTMPLQFFKGCLPQVLLGPFLNTLTYLCLKIILKKLARFFIQKIFSGYLFVSICLENDLPLNETSIAKIKKKHSSFSEIPSYSTRSYFCQAQRHRNIDWPTIYSGGQAIVDCPSGTTGFCFFITRI